MGPSRVGDYRSQCAVQRRDRRHRRFPFSSALVLPGLNIYEGVGIDDPEKVKWRDFVFLARGRDLRGAIFDLASLLKVDFNGDLRDASLNGAQLQGASLGAAQLQGASLGGAQLQGASLDNAQLQGAWLSDLQFLYSPRQLQPGGWLPSPQFQGMSLRAAQLQGASLAGAQLQGASLVRANLQGASLDGANLPGASLGAAIVDATDLSGAYLWRTHRFEGLWLPPMDATNLMSGESWLPEWEAEGRTPRPWDTTAYQALRNMIESLPVGNNRDSALSRIERLDCANPDPAFASCDRSAGPTPEAKAWREALEATRVNEQAYEEALAYALFSLVCLSNDAMYVVRGEGFLARLEGAGTAASGLIDDLINTDSKHCPDAPALTSDDRVNLLHIKENIEEVKAQQKSLF